MDQSYTIKSATTTLPKRATIRNMRDSGGLEERDRVEFPFTGSLIPNFNRRCTVGLCWLVLFRA